MPVFEYRKNSRLYSLAPFAIPVKKEDERGRKKKKGREDRGDLKRQGERRKKEGEKVREEHKSRVFPS